MPRYFYRGRHRAPSRAARQAAAVAVAASTVTIATAGTAHAGPPGGWDPIISCESGGNPRAQNPRSSASGLLQFIDSTWRRYGGLEFAKRAKDATPEQQLTVAERAYAANGLNDWSASKSCWGNKVKKAEKTTERADKPKKAEKRPARDTPEPSTTPERPAQAAAESPPPSTGPAPAPESPSAEPAAPAPAQPPVGAPQLGGGDVPTVRQHVVRPGDTLWGIAGPGWVELYERNRGVVGADPDLLLPGQVLDL